MAESYLTYTNKVLARLNEVQLTSSNFSNARGIQVQAQNAVNESIRYINQKEFQYPFNHSTKTETLVPGTIRYSIPTTAKTVDYNTFRIVKDSDLGSSGGRLYVLTYNEYVNNRENADRQGIAVDITMRSDKDMIFVPKSKATCIVKEFLVSHEIKILFFDNSFITGFILFISS